MVDYIMRNSIVSINKLNKLDIKIRSKINKQLKGKALPRDFFYTRPQDGGLGFTKLEERYEVNKVVNISHLLNSEIRTRVMEDIDYVARKRNIRIQKGDDNLFFDWKEENVVDHPRHGSYHSQIYEAYKAVKKLGLTISFTDHSKKNIKVMKGIDDTIFSQDSSNNHIGKMSQDIMKLLRKEHRTELQNLLSCGKTFKTLQKSNQANFMMNNCKAPIPDSLLRFIIQSRCGTLITPALKYKFHWIERDEIICSCWEREEPCNLYHISNHCKKRLPDYTIRHNNVLEKVKDLIELTINPDEFHLNKSIKLKEVERRGMIQPFSGIHPDMWYWNESEKLMTLEIIEMKVPWGTAITDEAGEVINSLEKVERKAIKKYEELIEGNIERGTLGLKDIIKKEINGKKTKIQLTVLVVSSLGALGPKTFGKI
jgi:hypothetical protein